MTINERETKMKKEKFFITLLISLYIVLSLALVISRSQPALAGVGAWRSGWIVLNPNVCSTLNHNLGEYPAGVHVWSRFIPEVGEQRASSEGRAISPYDIDDPIYVANPGQYTIWVAPNSAEICNTAAIRMTYQVVLEPGY